MKGKALTLLTPKAVDILRAVHFYRFMGALDVACLLSSPGALTRVRKTLLALSGGADFVEREYLYRFRLQGEGNAERVYTLGSRGRDFLVNELGLPVSWYFRPHKIKHFSHAHVVHGLLLTRFLVAAKRFAEGQAGLTLTSSRTGYELAELAPGVLIEDEEGKRAVRVVPDAWLLFTRVEGRRERSLGLLLEIDRGREYQAAFKQHVASRVEFIASGAYERVFGSRGGVRIAYATTGERPEYRQRRVMTMMQWTAEVLKEARWEDWADVFRFCALDLDTLYQLPLFSQPLWQRIGARAPVGLF